MDSSTCFCISFNFSASSSISFTLALMASSSFNIPPHNIYKIYGGLYNSHKQLVDRSCSVFAKIAGNVHAPTLLKVKRDE